MTKPLRFVKALPEPLRERIIVGVVNLLRKTDPIVKITVYETAVKISWDPVPTDE